MAALKLMIVVVVMVIASFQLQSTVAQTRYVVGDATGWTIPASNGLYNTWASGKTFNVGDTLVFNFTTGAHDVAEVSQSSYGPCTKTSPILQIETGPATIVLNTSGNHYYICAFGQHCNLGQKLTINVAGTASTPPAGATPAPTGSAMSPPPPSPSGASSFKAVVPVTILAAALALLY